MKSIVEVRSQLDKGDFEFSSHALRGSIERNISEQEVREVGREAIIIEDYPDDKYSPSCLLLGFTRTGRPLHIQVALEPSRLLRIITLYEPDLGQWSNYFRRK